MPKDHLKPHQFKKGQSGNPLGGKLHNKEIKMIKNLTQMQIAEIGSLLLTGNIDQIRALAGDKQASVLKVWFASVISTGIDKGDAFHLNAFLDRIIGKVPDKIQTENLHLVELLKRYEGMSDEDLIKDAVDAIEILKEEKSIDSK